MGYDYYRLGRVYPRTALREPYPPAPTRFPIELFPVAPGALEPFPAYLMLPQRAPIREPGQVARVERFEVELFPLAVVAPFPVFLLLPQRAPIGEAGQVPRIERFLIELHPTPAVRPFPTHLMMPQRADFDRLPSWPRIERFEVELHPTPAVRPFPTHLMLPQRADFARVASWPHIERFQVELHPTPAVRPFPIYLLLPSRAPQPGRIFTIRPERIAAELFAIPISAGEPFPVSALLPTRSFWQPDRWVRLVERFPVELYPYVTPAPMDPSLLVSILSARIPLWLRLRPASVPRSTTAEAVAVFSAPVVPPITISARATLMDLGRLGSMSADLGDAGLTAYVYKYRAVKPTRGQRAPRGPHR